MSALFALSQPVSSQSADSKQRRTPWVVWQLRSWKRGNLVHLQDTPKENNTIQLNKSDFSVTVRQGEPCPLIVGYMRGTKFYKVFSLATLPVGRCREDRRWGGSVSWSPVSYYCDVSGNDDPRKLIPSQLGQLPSGMFLPLAGTVTYARFPPEAL